MRVVWGTVGGEVLFRGLRRGVVAVGDGMGSGMTPAPLSVIVRWLWADLDYDLTDGDVDSLARCNPSPSSLVAALASAGWFLVRTGEGGEMTTYSDPDGDLVMGEFAFVTELEWFENDDDPTPLRRQRWVCVADDDGAYWPRGRMKCGRCGNDGAGCADCGGTGKNPTADAGFIPASPAARPSGEPTPERTWATHDEVLAEYGLTRADLDALPDDEAAGSGEQGTER